MAEKERKIDFDVLVSAIRQVHEHPAVRAKDHALVEFALAGMDNSLFVSKYQLELSSKEDIQRFLKENRRETSKS